MCVVPSHPMGRFPWDSHRNDIPMDKPGNRGAQQKISVSSKVSKRIVPFQQEFPI